MIPLIYQFLGEEAFSHDYNKLRFDTPDYDEGLGLAGLHMVRQIVSLEPPDLFEQYSRLSDWYNTASSRCNVLMARP